MCRTATTHHGRAAANRWPRAFAAWLSVVVFACASIGFRLHPERLAAIASNAGAAERFPCEGCACGCAGAAQCWTQCCCHSLDERIAWAQANDVPLPRAIAGAAFARLQQQARERGMPECCRSSSTGACCASSSLVGARAGRLPAMSSLACKGVTGWLVPHTPSTPSSLVGVAVPAPTGAVSFGAPGDARRPRDRGLEPPRVPPRRPLSA